MKKVIKYLTVFIFITILCLYAATWIPLSRDALRIYEQKSETILIKDRHGYLLREIPLKDGLKTRWVKLADISPHLINATIYAEDKRFYSHLGFDPIAIIRASIQNIRAGRIVSGGSTITQQVVRNIFHLDRSYQNKIIEIWYAARLEHMLSKKEILELYLNIAPYSNNVTGIEAASQLYLQKPALHLSLSESAFLAAIPQSPSNLNPYMNRDNLLNRKKHILNEMLELKAISKSDYDSALSEPIALYTDKSPFKAPHFTDWVITQLSDAIKSSGGEVMTTLDLPMQTQVEKLLHNTLKMLKKDNVTNGSVIVIDNRTGEILVMVGSVDYFYHDGGQVNGALSLRQPGSSIKPFTYSLAFEKGYTPASLLADIETHIGDYTPDNYDDMYHGPVSLRTALASSYNIPAVMMAEDIGVDKLLNRLHKIGFDSLRYNADHYGPGLTLGNGEVTLLEMVRAYRTIANGGSYSSEKIFLSQPTAKPKYVFSPDVAYLLTNILSDPVARFPTFGRNGPLELPFAVAAKTGTTSDFRDNWTIGYSRDYTVGVWVGNFDGYPMEGVSGITGAGPLFRDIVMELYKDKEYPKPFEIPKNIISMDVCSVSGDLPGRYCKNLKREVFIYGKEPKNTCIIHKAFLLDKRNGLLVGADTPAEDVEEKIYEIYPPIFSEWAAGQDIPVAPTQVSSVGDANSLSIAFPKNGDVFKLDPALPYEAQSIPLKAVVPHDIEKIIWKVDGKIIAVSISPFVTQMPLKTGNHIIEIEAQSGGKVVHGKAVLIDILSLKE